MKTYKFKTSKEEYFIIQANNLMSADWIAITFDSTARLFTITK